MRLIINYYIVYKAILDLLLEHKKFQSYNTFYFKHWALMNFFLPIILFSYSQDVLEVVDAYRYLGVWITVISARLSRLKRTMRKLI